MGGQGGPIICDFAPIHYLLTDKIPIYCLPLQYQFSDYLPDSDKWTIGQLDKCPITKRTAHSNVKKKCIVELYFNHRAGMNSFQIQAKSENMTETHCGACVREFKEGRDSLLYQCPECNTVYCCDCDIFFHETLHSCPGCVGARQKPMQTNGKLS